MQKNTVQWNERYREDAIFKLIKHSSISLDIIYGIAGDRKLAEEEIQSIKEFKSSRGDLFYSDLLFSISHQQFVPTIAKQMWNEILEHKYNISKVLNRNVGICVATLDYLTNLKTDIVSPTVISEYNISTIADLAFKDGLTKLFNYSSFYEKLKDEINLFKRKGDVFSLLFIDIDNFKQFNDKYGHLEGNKILTKIAVILDTTTRDMDLCSRYGGEEFAVILPKTNLEDAFMIAERIRFKVEETFNYKEVLTVSIGVGIVSCNCSTASDLVSVADKALYESKKRGKNKVFVLQNTKNT